MFLKGNCGRERDPAPFKVTYQGKDQTNRRNLRCREVCSSKVEYRNPIKNPKDDLNYRHSHQNLRRLVGAWAPNPWSRGESPRKGREMPGWGLFTETSSPEVSL